jgi:MerR family transcriptional regulator, aldehyde-responsive regulator
MPLKNIQEYMKYSLDKNDEACKRILEEHKKQITKQVTELQDTLDIIKSPIFSE